MAIVCYNLYSVTAVIIQHVLIDIPSLFMSFFSIICIARILKNKKDSNASNSNLFKYLLVKSMVELLVFMLEVFTIRMYNHPDTPTSRARWIWYWYLNYYAEYSLLYVSSLMEIAATFDCLISVWNKYKWMLSGLAFWIVVICSFVVSFAYHSYIILQAYIAPYNQTIQVSENVTKTILKYRYINTPFYGSQTSINLMLAESLIRDLGFLVIIFLLNFLVLLEIKKVTQRRRAMNKSGSDKTIQTALTAERNKCVMIMVTGVNYFLGHSLYAIYQFAILSGAAFRDINSWICVFRIGYDLLMLSYGVSFILYYVFNKQFNRYANDALKMMITPIMNLFGIKWKKETPAAEKTMSVSAPH